MFCWPVSIYYEDVDAGGVVYHANYLKFFERARTEWLKSFGVQQSALLAENIAFVVANEVAISCPPVHLFPWPRPSSLVVIVKGSANKECVPSGKANIITNTWLLSSTQKAVVMFP